MKSRKLQRAFQWFSRYILYSCIMAYPKIIHDMSTNTPMMIRANSILGIDSNISFMAQRQCFSCKKGGAFPCQCVYFLCFRCLLRRKQTPILTIYSLLLCVFLIFIEKWLILFFIIWCCICNLFFSPFGRRTTFL